MPYYVTEGIVEKPANAVFFRDYAPAVQQELEQFIQSYTVKIIRTNLNADTYSWRVYWISRQESDQFDIDKESCPPYTQRSEYDRENNIVIYETDKYETDEIPDDEQ